MLLKFLSFQLADFTLYCDTYFEVDDPLPVIDNCELVKRHIYLRSS